MFNLTQPKTSHGMTPDTQPEELGKFGKLVVEKEFASLQKVRAVIQHQRKLLLRGKKVRLGDLMVKLGVITAEQQTHILSIQNSSGSQIPGYEIMEKLGQGGMGAVYKGRQINMDRIVAVKTLNPQLAAQKAYIEKFLKEAKSVAKLNHNNIVKGIDVGQNKGRYYFIMEYVDGPTIQNKLDKEGFITEALSLKIVLQIADAIRYINQFKIVHRDIKPDNIILTSNNIPKLADLGLVLTNDDTGSLPAANIKSSSDSSSTGINTSFVGTPHYISPEQAQEKTVDFRSDIYSLGATLFHMITGQTPFNGDRSIIIMTKHITEDLRYPREINPSLGKGLCDLVMKMMEKDPEDRQQSPEELIADITAVIETGELPNAIKRPSRVKKARRVRSNSSGSGRGRKRRVRRGGLSSSRKKSSRNKKHSDEDNNEPLEVTTDEFLMTDSEINEKYSCRELLNLSKETKEFAKKEEFLLQAMNFDNEENDVYTLEAKCRYSYLVSVIRKDEAIETLLEIIEDYIDYNDNKYYQLAETKLKELNHS